MVASEHPPDLPSLNEAQEMLGEMFKEYGLANTPQRCVAFEWQIQADPLTWTWTGRFFFKACIVQLVVGLATNIDTAENVIPQLPTNMDMLNAPGG